MVYVCVVKQQEIQFSEVENVLQAHQANEYENPQARRNFHSPEIFSKNVMKNIFSIQTTVELCCLWLSGPELKRQSDDKRGF